MQPKGRLAKPMVMMLFVSNLVLAGLASFDTGAAQGFGFLFDRPAVHRTRTPRHRPARFAATIPLPVPRPRFPEDTAAKAPSIIAAPTVVPVPAQPSAASSAASGNANVTRREAHGADATNNGATRGGEAPKIPSGDLSKPAVAPSGADATFNPRQPAVDEACPGRLAAGNVAAEAVTIGAQPDARCTVVQPVRLSEVTLPDGSKVAFPDHPTIACETADTFARYVRELLVPLARGSYGAPIDAVWTGPGLECRARDHVRGAKLSAHGQGLAIDIAQLKLADGRKIEVGDPRTATDQGFETAARAAACGYFHTTLGPGSDSYHRNHWHFDLEQRGRTGDAKYCK